MKAACPVLPTKPAGDDPDMFFEDLPAIGPPESFHRFEPRSDRNISNRSLSTINSTRRLPGGILKPRTTARTQQEKNNGDSKPLFGMGEDANKLVTNNLGSNIVSEIGCSSLTGACTQASSIQQQEALPVPVLSRPRKVTFSHKKKVILIRVHTSSYQNDRNQSTEKSHGQVKASGDTPAK